MASTSSTGAGTGVATTIDARDVLHQARFELYRENVDGALALLRAAHETDPDPRFAEQIARIEGWLAHLRSRDAYIAAQERQYRGLRWRLGLKLLEKQVRILIGRKTRKMIRRRAADREFRLLEAEVVAAGARRVVDGGCGEGAVALALSSRHPALRVEALDVSATNVRIARGLHGGRFPNVTFQQGLIEELDKLFPVGSLDVVYCFAVLEHVRDVDDTVRAVLAALRPGGRFCFVVPMREFSVSGELPEYRPIHGFLDHLRVFSEADLRARFGRYPGFVLHKVPSVFEPEDFERALVPVEFGTFFVAFSRP